MRELIVRMRKETGYGYTRLKGELCKLGIRISRQTIKTILVEAGLQPEPEDSHDSWDAFLARHAATLWQCDFVTKPMWTPKGLVDLYLLVFLHLGTRRCWISPCTARPDSAWVSQQARNFLMEADRITSAISGRAARPWCDRGVVSHPEAAIGDWCCRRSGRRRLP